MRTSSNNEGKEEKKEESKEEKEELKAADLEEEETVAAEPYPPSDNENEFQDLNPGPPNMDQEDQHDLLMAADPPDFEPLEQFGLFAPAGDRVSEEEKNAEKLEKKNRPGTGG